jgi:hypothetical protein
MYGTNPVREMPSALAMFRFAASSSHAGIVTSVVWLPPLPPPPDMANSFEYLLAKYHKGHFAAS